MNSALRTLELHTQELIHIGLMKQAEKDFIDEFGQPVLSAIVGEDAAPECAQRYRNYAEYMGEGQISAIPGLLKLVSSLENMGNLAGENPGGQKYNAYQHMFYGNDALYTMYNTQQGHMLSNSGGITPATLYGLLYDMSDTTSARGRALVKHLMTPQGQRTRDDLMVIINQYKPLMNEEERAELDQTINLLQDLQTNNPQYEQQNDYGEWFQQYPNKARKEGILPAIGSFFSDVGTVVDAGAEYVKNNLTGDNAQNTNTSGELPIAINPARADLFARFSGADMVHAQLSKKLQQVLKLLENNESFNDRYPWATAAVRAQNYESWGNTPQERRRYINATFKKPTTTMDPSVLLNPNNNLGAILRTAIPGLGMGLPLALLAGRSGSSTLLPMLLAAIGMGCYGYGRRNGHFGAPNEGINPIMDSLTNGFWNLPQMFGLGKPQENQQENQTQQPVRTPVPPSIPDIDPVENDPPETYTSHTPNAFPDQTQYSYQPPDLYEPQQPQQYEPDQPDQPDILFDQQYANDITDPGKNTQHIS